jgi:hypothetical protein
VIEIEGEKESGRETYRERARSRMHDCACEGHVPALR